MVHEDEVRLSKEIMREAISVKEGLPSSDSVGEDVTYEVEMGSEKGDNFTCTVFAVKAKATLKDSKEEKEYEFIAKVIPVEPSRVAFVKYSNLNATEVFFYSKIAPELRAYAKAQSDLRVFFPEAYYVDDEAGVFIFENFKAQGYKMGDRKAGLDEDHIQLAYRRLGEHHALTHHYLQKNGGTSSLEEVGLTRKTWLLETPVSKEIVGYMNTLIQTLAEVVPEPELSKDLKAYFEEKNPGERMNDVTGSESTFDVILHGDAWMNNFLFKYDDKGVPIDMVAVDFQISRVGDPAQDVSHLMFPCTSPEVRKDQWENWISVYYGSLGESLKKLGYDVGAKYSEDALKESFANYRTFGFMLATFMSMSMLTDEAKEGGSMDMDNFKGQELSDVMKSTEKTVGMLKACNSSLKERLIDLAKEAKSYGIF
eukprot:TRINITY_DN938_c0_g1_i1.p2 TRINITY_DN938_c0_g1~~TRINITY_DN938_c0_g1_i1.p2  ORF type:complete len:425 (+),score=139.42 TRINITY_DN938_c0_g1_i1:58-1332(+)